MKTIIIACGSGIATSTVVSDRLDDVLDDAGIEHEFIQCSVPEIDTYIDQADLIVTTITMEKEYEKPKINALSYLTGDGEEETTEKIIDLLQN